MGLSYPQTLRRQNISKKSRHQIMCRPPEYSEGSRGTNSYLSRGLKTCYPLQTFTYVKQKFLWSKERLDAIFSIKKSITSPSMLLYPDADKALVMEMGVLSISIGLVLYQKKKNGKMHPIQFACPTVKHTDKTYLTGRLESLEGIFSLRKFQVNLQSFWLFTWLPENQSLAYNFKNNDGQQ